MEKKELLKQINEETNNEFMNFNTENFHLTKDELVLLRTVSSVPPNLLSKEDYVKAEEAIRNAVIRSKSKSIAATPIYVGEKTSDERITKSSGYIPLPKQIDMLLEAGVNMEKAREGMYDYQDEDDIDLTRHPDPTRHPSYDISDAFEDAKRLEGRLEEIIEKGKITPPTEEEKTASESVQEGPPTN